MNHWWCYPVALIAGAAGALCAVGAVLLILWVFISLMKFIEESKSKIGKALRFTGDAMGWLGLTVAFPLLLIKFGLEILKHFGYCTNVKFFL